MAGYIPECAAQPLDPLLRAGDGDPIGVTVTVLRGDPVSFYHRTTLRINGSTYSYTIPTEHLEANWTFTTHLDPLPEEKSVSKNVSKMDYYQR